MPLKPAHLATTDYPIYCVKSLDSRYFIVAGGGGCSKTGVDNSLALYEIGSDMYHVYGKIVSIINMGLYAPMNIALKPVEDKLCNYYLALGMGDMCQTYQLHKSVEKKLVENIISNPTSCNINHHVTKARHRTISCENYEEEIDKGLLANGVVKVGKSNGTLAHQDKSQVKNELIEDELLTKMCKKNGFNHANLLNKKLKEEQMDLNKAKLNTNAVIKSVEKFSSHASEYEFFSEFTLKPLESVKTDTVSVTGHQKAVRICSKRNLILTGATDGHARLWKMDKLSKVLDIKAHQNEVDDIEIHPSEPHVVTASRDGHAYVWNLTNGSKICELEWTIGQHYRLRACRYGQSRGDGPDGRDKIYLFTVHIPCRRSKVAQPCYLTKWSIKGDVYSVARVRVTGTEESYILSLEHSGKYLAIGTSGGSVSVYKTTDLKRIAHFPNAHDIFVTGLDFVCLPATQSPSTATPFLQPPYFAGADACLLSISVDRHIQFYRIYESRRSVPYFLLAAVFFVISILLTLTLC